MTPSREHAVNNTPDKPDIAKNGFVRGCFSTSARRRTAPDIFELQTMIAEHQELTAKPDNPEMPGHPDICPGTPPRTDIPPFFRKGEDVRVSCPGVMSGPRQREG